MKYLLFFGLLIGSASAQTKHDNMIVVHDVTFSECLTRALDAGYTFASKDEALQIFTTAQKNDKHNNPIVLHVRVIGDSALITGELNLLLTYRVGTVSTTTPATEIEFKGAKNSPLKQSWNSMNDFAMAFGKVVTYRRN